MHFRVAVHQSQSLYLLQNKYAVSPVSYQSTPTTVCSIFDKGYRYGFNGKEKDNETNLQDYGKRIYNSRLGKFLSVDPLAFSYPWNSSYAFAENDVIRCIDIEGLEKYIATLTGEYNGKKEYTICLSNQSILEQTAQGVPLISFNGGEDWSTDFRFKELQCYFQNVYFENGNLIHPDKEKNIYGTEPNGIPRLNSSPATGTFNNGTIPAPQINIRIPVSKENTYINKVTYVNIFSKPSVADQPGQILGDYNRTDIIDKAGDYQFAFNSGIAGTGNQFIVKVNGVEIFNQTYNEDQVKTVNFTAKPGDVVELFVGQAKNLTRATEDGFNVELNRVETEKVVDTSAPCP